MSDGTLNKYGVFMASTVLALLLFAIYANTEKIAREVMVPLVTKVEALEKSQIELDKDLGYLGERSKNTISKTEFSYLKEHLEQLVDRTKSMEKMTSQILEHILTQSREKERGSMRRERIEGD